MRKNFTHFLEKKNLLSLDHTFSIKINIRYLCSDGKESRESRRSGRRSGRNKEELKLYQRIAFLSIRCFQEKLGSVWNKNFETSRVMPSATWASLHFLSMLVRYCPSHLGSAQISLCLLPYVPSLSSL